MLEGGVGCEEVLKDLFFLEEEEEWDLESLYYLIVEEDIIEILEEDIEGVSLQGDFLNVSFIYYV